MQTAHVQYRPQVKRTADTSCFEDGLFNCMAYLKKQNYSCMTNGNTQFKCVSYCRDIACDKLEFSNYLYIQQLYLQSNLHILWGYLLLMKISTVKIIDLSLLLNVCLMLKALQNLD
jgi:hypothetical protein